MTTELIWNRFSGRILNFIKTKVNDPVEAEDVLSEVFEKIHRKLRSLKEHEKLVPWMFQISRNTITDHYRKKQPVSVDISEIPVLAQEMPEQERMDLDKCLAVFVGKLPEKYREAVRMSELETLKHAEVADKLGLSLSATKSRILRGREMLKEMFVACCHFERDKRGKLIGDPRLIENCPICYPI